MAACVVALEPGHSPKGRGLKGEEMTMRARFTLSKSAIRDIEESLARGLTCHVSLIAGTRFIYIRAEPPTQLFDLPFPVLICQESANEPAIVRVSKSERYLEGFTTLAELPVGPTPGVAYWLTGLKIAQIIRMGNEVKR